MMNQTSNPLNISILTDLPKAPNFISQEDVKRYEANLKKAALRSDFDRFNRMEEKRNRARGKRKRSKR